MSLGKDSLILNYSLSQKSNSKFQERTNEFLRALETINGSSQKICKTFNKTDKEVLKFSLGRTLVNLCWILGGKTIEKGRDEETKTR